MPLCFGLSCRTLTLQGNFQPLLYQERKWEMEAANMVDSHSLYTESSRLRALARMLEGNGDVERPDITFTAIELDGFASLLAAVADDIDAYRDL